MPRRSLVASVDQAAHDRPVVLAEAGLDGSVEELLDRLRAVELDARLLAEQQGIAEVLPRITRRDAFSG